MTTLIERKEKIKAVEPSIPAGNKYELLGKGSSYAYEQ